jgi:hypothetical protein
MTNSNDTLNREVKNTFRGKSIICSKEAREYLSISESQLDNLCHNQVLRYSRPSTANSKGEIVAGRKRYFKVDDLDKWLSSNYIEAI